MALEAREKPMEELAASLRTRRDKRVVVFGSSIPEDTLETIKMLRKARDESNGHAPKEKNAPNGRQQNGVSRKKRAEFFSQKI